MQSPVAIPGLAGLRQDMRLVQRSMLGELRNAEKAAGKIIADAAAAKAPRGKRPLPKNRKKRLHETIKVTAAGNRVSVGASAKVAPHANVVHWGGTIHPRSGESIHFSRRPFIAQAFDEHRDEFVALLAEQIDQLARRHGWL